MQKEQTPNTQMINVKNVLNTFLLFWENHSLS